MRRKSSPLTSPKKIACTLVRLFLGAVTLFCVFLFGACSNASQFDMVKVWTSESSIVLYTAEWNKTHSTKISVLYKPFPLDELSTTRDPPDIIIGTWLRNKETKKEFYCLDKLFGKSALSPLQSETFYEKVLDAGKIGREQYLLPISFNVPVVLLGEESKATQTIDLEALKGHFMAQSSDDFLYFFTKARSASYIETAKRKGDFLPFGYNGEALDKAISQLKTWAEAFGGVEKEREFVYKWLRIPDEKKLTSGKAQFAYTTSDKVLPGEKTAFITIDGELPIEDNLLMMGLLKRGNNKMGAMKVAEWFFKEDVQKSFVELAKNTNSDIKVFGVAGGYSSVKALNSGVFPRNATFRTFEQKPRNWEALKRAVVIPYIKDALQSSDGKIFPMSARYNQWKVEQQ